MNIIGFDPGIDFTGFAVIDGSAKKPKYVSSGIIENIPARKFPTHQRLAHIQQEALKLLAKHQPQYCGVEQPFSGAFPKSALTLSMALGAIMAALGHYKPAQAQTQTDENKDEPSQLQVIALSPSEIKSMIAGKGNASKEQVATMALRHLNLTGSLPPDASDAIAIALCVFYKIN